MSYSMYKGADLPRGYRMVVMAGTHEQAERYAASVGLKRDQWMFASSYERILGMRGFDYVRYGTWWERPDANQILEQFRIAGAIEHSVLEGTKDG